MQTLPAACAVLAGVVLLILPGAGWFAYSRYGMQGLWATLAAAGVCWVSATAALIVTKRWSGTPHAVNAVLFAMGLRTGLPLVAAFVLTNSVPFLAAGGVFGMILVFYLPALAAETLLSVRLLKTPATKDKQAGI